VVLIIQPPAGGTEPESLAVVVSTELLGDLPKEEDEGWSRLAFSDTGAQPVLLNDTGAQPVLFFIASARS